MRGGTPRLPQHALFTTASVAGIMAAKRTASLIPMCHPIPITRCDVTVRKRTASVAQLERLSASPTLDLTTLD